MTPDENEVIVSNDKFYISYNPHPGEFTQAIDKLIYAFGASPEPELGRAETALCVREREASFGVRFHILYGDHRDGYKPLIEKGLAACLQYYRDHIHLKAHSDFSEWKGTL